MAGSLILLASLLPIRQFIIQLPPGKLKRDWALQTGLIFFFIFGYISYIVLDQNQYFGTHDLLVPTIFFLGAIYVHLVIRLSLKTAQDMKRLAILEYENITDTLTGIYNRRYLDTRIKEEFARALRYQHPVSFLLLDIDHFKKINDSYSYQIGDMVLKELARTISQLVRDVDLVARYGGEEIVIIAPNTTLEYASQLAERLRKKIQFRTFCPISDDSTNLSIQATISIGVAVSSKQNITVEKLIKSAEVALLKAKKSGRNCVVVCEDEQCEQPKRPHFGENTHLKDLRE